MAPIRKLKQISNYDEKSNGSPKSNSNKNNHKNKRMKNTDTTEDSKVAFESNKKVFQLLSRGPKIVTNTCLIIVRLTTLKKKYRCNSEIKNSI